MGGKHKQQAQKVKNNLKPSSSGRTAELVASMNSVHQFSGIKDMGCVSTELTFNINKEDLDLSLNKDFQIIFKRMNKKDSITKIKALQEFASMVSQSDDETVKAVVKYWIRLYNTFVNDLEHKVREATHNAHLQIILKNKKSLAPYLKQIIGPWFVSQFDTFPLAASAASKSFLASFPSNKAKECILYCQKDILSYIFYNIEEDFQGQGSVEDSDVKYEKNVVSSLQGYSLYLTSLNEEEIKDNLELNNQIINSPKFIKLANHKSSLVRANWFKVLSTILQKALFLFKDYNFVVKTILGNVKETESTVTPSIWEAIILVMDLIEEWWMYIDLKKDFFNKLWKQLKEGGSGNTSVIYPNLIYVLSKMPISLQDNTFYNNLFNNISLGLKKKIN